MNKLLFAKKIMFLSVMILCFLVSQAQEGNLVLSFENKFGAEPLQFQKDYENVHGEKVSFTLLNYFVTNIKLVRTDGTIYTLPQDSCYFLVKQGEPQSKNISITVPKGKYKSLSFLIGVDSLRSTQGADKRGGALDIGADARGMYWAWNSGYIFFKMEGISPASPDSLQNEFFYHIGGFGGFDKKTLNNIRVKSLEFNKPLKISSKTNATILVAVDVKKFFEGKTPLKIGQSPSVMWGPVSTQIADNYVDVFSLKGVNQLKIKK